MTRKPEGTSQDPGERASDRERPAFYEALGRAVKVARTERGMERKDLAEATGLSYAYLSDIESGRRRASSRALLAIAGAMDMSPSGLVRAAEVLTVRMARTGSAPRPPQTMDLAAPASAAPEPTSVRAAETSLESTRPRSWFRDEPRSPALSMRTGFADLGDVGDPRDVARIELEQLVERLGPEDLELVLDLARRLARGSPMR